MIKNKRGISGVVTVVIMIALVMVATSIVWAVISKLMTSQIETTQSCFGNFGKVSINSRYTCYDDTQKKFRFSVNVGDVDLDGVVVIIEGSSLIKSYTIMNASTTIPNIVSYPSNSNTLVVPGKNSGLTYSTSEFSSKPDSVKISPIIDGNQCDISDSLEEIDFCSSSI